MPSKRGTKSIMVVSLLRFSLIASVNAHIAIFTPAMWGFNVSFETFPYDNRPVAPLVDYTFDQWWFHGHLDHPPNPGDIFHLPAGKPATAELACHKGATSYCASADGGVCFGADNYPCPGSPLSQFHTNGPWDLKGCALAITYESDVTNVKPEDFTIFSVNHTCVWYKDTNFQVPARMPSCPEGGCICAWFWIHSEKSGGEQNYMNGFRCQVTDSVSNVGLAPAKVARRCGADPERGVMKDTPGNCTYGAKQPLYWFQKERNNMFEGTYSPPVYLDLYNFKDGAQNDIFLDSYTYIPTPDPKQSQVPTPIDHSVPQRTSTGTPDPNSVARTMRERGALDSLLVASLSIVASYAGGVF